MKNITPANNKRKSTKKKNRIIKAVVIDGEKYKIN